MRSTHAKVIPELCLWEFKHFTIQTLVIESHCLKKNPLNDSAKRFNPVLIPKKTPPKEGYPVVLVLSGYSGNGPRYFAPKTFEENGPQVLDACLGREEAAAAIYCFVDAMTFWGGSQFINSKGMGLYEDFIIQELVPSLKQSFPVQENAKYWCVSGGSSGGYGALHLTSKHPEIFGICAAIAPDCFFEASLLPEIRKIVPHIEKIGGVAAVKKELIEGKLLSRKVAFDILNVVAMGLCYAPSRGENFVTPIDHEGRVIEEKWSRWLEHDPLCFLKERQRGIQSLRAIYLDVGDRDQFHLQFGARQIKKLLHGMKVSLSYHEFSGTHWDIGKRRPEMWLWLKKQWEK